MTHRIIYLLVIIMWLGFSACSQPEPTSESAPPPEEPGLGKTVIDNGDGTITVTDMGSGKGMVKPPTVRPPEITIMPPPPLPSEVNDPQAGLLSELKQYPIAYETPETGEIGTPFDVTLAIDATGDDTAIEGLPQQARVIESTAKLSKLVEASLSGAAFDITLTNSKRQQLSPLRESVWRWSVTPIREGSHTLYLEIHAIVGADQTMLLDSFSDNINVEVAAAPNEVNRAEDVRTYVSIIGGIISILLGIIALTAHLKKRGKPDAPDKDA